MTRLWIGLAALFVATAIGSAPADAQGKSGKNLKPLFGSFGRDNANAGGLGSNRAIGLGNAKSGVAGGILSGGTNLPPGLAKMNQLPPGLAKMGQLPPGLAKGHAVPPGLAKMNQLPPGLSQ